MRARPDVSGRVTLRAGLLRRAAAIHAATASRRAAAAESRLVAEEVRRSRLAIGEAEALRLSRALDRWRAMAREARRRGRGWRSEASDSRLATRDARRDAEAARGDAEAARGDAEAARGDTDTARAELAALGERYEDQVVLQREMQRTLHALEQRAAADRRGAR